MTEGSFILQILGMVIVIWLLGNYAITEGHRKEQQKKFYRNMNNFDKNKK